MLRLLTPWRRAGQTSFGSFSSTRRFAAFSTRAHAEERPNPCGVYANHDIRLDEIDVHGFDYDFTLAGYAEPALQKLIYDLARTHMVDEMQYPRGLRAAYDYDPSFAVRGLHFDTRRGNLLKLDFVHNVDTASAHVFFGRRALGTEEVAEAYGGADGFHRVKKDYHKHLRFLGDLFCLAEAALLADTIQHFVDAGIGFDAACVSQDVFHAISHVHVSGSLHRRITARIESYISPNPGVATWLRQLQAAGKKMFLLTNSPFAFVDRGMRTILGDQWRGLFDVILCQADKPTFYTSGRPFRRLLLADDAHTRGSGLSWAKVDAFVPGAVYLHGSLRELRRITGWSASRVLYTGDHVIADLVEAGSSGWRTAMVIRELERDIEVQSSARYRALEASSAR